MITLRPATLEDVPELYAVMASAFHGSALDSRVWPPSDPRSAPDQIANIAKYISNVTVAEEEVESATDTATAKVIQGWSSWTRRPADDPSNTVNPEDFPPEGDRDLAVRFFQNNADRSRAIAPSGSPYWFLAIMVVRPSAQRKGVGAALMEAGVRRADEEGLVAVLNASRPGKGLYERHGFRTIEDTAFEHGIHSFHMRREARGRE